MKNKLYKTAKAVVPSLLLLLFLLPACFDESGSTPDIPETKYAKLTITLGSVDNALPSYTKGVVDGYGDNDIVNPDSADLAFEHHIDDWYIVVVNKEGKVDRVVSNTKDAYNKDEDSKTSVEMELVIGETYSFYAFANLGGLKDDGTAVIQELLGLKDKTFNDFRNTAVELQALTAYTGETGTSYIPMSSYVGTCKVTDNVATNKVELSLIRLLGKVQIDVTNSTGVDLTVEELKMGPFRQSGNIYLLPYDAIDNDPGKPNLLVKDNKDDKLRDPTFPGDPITGTNWLYVPTGDDKSIVKDKERRYLFYINETNQASVDPQGGDMKIALKVNGTGIERDDTPKSTNFFFIRRNDLLKVPILISNAETEIEFEQKHMPIGGLPTAYQFKPGVQVAARTFITDHAGDITISYHLKNLNGSVLNGTASDEWRLKYYTSGTTVKPGEHFCYAELTENTLVASTNTGFVLIPDTKDELSWWSAVGNVDTDKPICAFPLVSTQENNLSSTNKGSFTITVQELVNAASATIKLTLVTVNNAGTEVVLPYTLIIKNKEGSN